MNTTESMENGTIISPLCEDCHQRDTSLKRVEDVLNLYISPITIIVGTVGNILSLVVLQSRQYKSTPTTYALSTLALIDIGVLNTGLLRYWIKEISGIDVRNLSNFGCKIHAGLTYWTGALTGIILAVTTVERFLSVWYPLRVKEWVTKRRMIWILSVLTFGILAGHIPMMIFIQLFHKGPYTICWFRSPKFDQIWHWAAIMLRIFIPVAVIFIGNILIVIGLKISAARRAKMFNQKRHDGSRSTTIMLITVSVVYLITIAPGGIFIIGDKYSAWTCKYGDTGPVCDLMYTFTQQLNYVNSAVNFLLYCLSGSKFRTALKNLIRSCICCKKKSKPQTGSQGTGASYIETSNTNFNSV